MTTCYRDVENAAVVVMSDCVNAQVGADREIFGRGW